MSERRRHGTAWNNHKTTHPKDVRIGGVFEGNRAVPPTCFNEREKSEMCMTVSDVATVVGLVGGTAGILAFVISWARRE